MLGRTRSVALLLLLVALQASGAEPDSTGPARSAGEPLVLHIRAFVGGTSQLNLWSDRIQWRHEQGSLPGAADEEPGAGPHPTFVNGAEWLPGWNGSTSASLELPFELPRDLSAVGVQIEEIAVRGELTLTQTKMLLVVQLDDTATEGADWYEFRLRVGAPGDAAGEAGAAAAPDDEPAPPSGPATLTASSNFIVQQAHYEATVSAARQLTAKRTAVEQAWRAAAQDQREAERLWQDGAGAQKRRDHWHAVAVEKRERMEYWARQGRTEDGVLYLPSPAYENYEQLREEVEEAESNRDIAAAAVVNLKREYDAALAEFQKAEAEYWRQKNAYDTAFAVLYATEYADRHAALSAQALEQQQSSAQSRFAKLTAETVVGSFVWMENGCDLGEVVLHPGGAFAAPASAYGQPQGWRAKEDGLHLAFEKAEWVFLPGPANCLFGVCAGPGLEEKGRRAMLRRQQRPKTESDSAGPGDREAAAETPSPPDGAGDAG